MRRASTKTMIVLLFAALSLGVTLQNERFGSTVAAKSRSSAASAKLWRDPVDIKSRDLFYGPGGKNRLPKGRLTFLKEDNDGASPKFLVKDEQGVRWKIKLGAEAQSEVAATRIVWAAGYFVDENYYMPEARIDKLPRLSRGQKYVAARGLVRGVRIERDEPGDKSLGTWDWFKNPFTGTRELNGLRTLIALINNWDPKRTNNAIRKRQGVEAAYYVSDLGASFGRTGGNLTRSKNDVKRYVATKFIRRVKDGRVNFDFRTRPSFFTILYPPYYCARTRLEQVARNIPRDDARWLGDVLDRLTPTQISDAFRAAGYSSEQVSAYTRKLRERIAELETL